MTKILSSLFIFLASSVALAYPAIGDFSVMQGTYTKAGKTSALTIEQKIVDYNAGLLEFTVVESQDVDGQVSTASATVPRKNLISQGQAQYLLLNCAAYGGSPETITVAAGTFKTCAMLINDSVHDGMTWVGDVEFGVVKKVIRAKQNAYSIRLELQKFGRAATNNN